MPHQFMIDPHAPKLLLKRGALVAAANWPVAIVQFVADAVFKTLLAVPIVGGIALVALFVGGDPADLLELEWSQIVPTLAGALVAQPIALASFLTAVGLVAAGGSALMIAVKAGTLTVLVEGERAAGPIEHSPLRLAALQRAARFSIERFTEGWRRLLARFLWLGAGLAGAYGLSIAGYASFVFAPLPETLRGAVPLGLASLALVIWITLLNFVYLLTQIVVAADDCALGDAGGRVARLLAARTWSILGVLAAILALMVLTTAASILATAALGLIAFVPFVGLAALPLQILAWVVRGIVFQYIALAGAAAYLRLYRLSVAP